MKLVFTKESMNDLIILREFIKKYNPEAAKRISQELLQRIEKLESFPLLGKVAYGSPHPSIRDFVFGNYLVRYAVQKESIIILRVWHTKESR